MIKVDKKHFEIFKEECNLWVQRFGLVNWRISYEFHKINGALGLCATFCCDRVAAISLSTEFEDTDNLNNDIKKTAFHEVMELMISPLNACAKSRYITESEIDEARHDIIRRLENVVWKNE